MTIVHMWCKGQVNPTFRRVTILGLKVLTFHHFSTIFAIFAKLRQNQARYDPDDFKYEFYVKFWFRKTGFYGKKAVNIYHRHIVLVPQLVLQFSHYFHN